MELLQLERGKFESNQSYVYRVLKNSILTMTLKPGDGISETELAERFGISRTPVRGVLNTLREEGLVNIEPQKRTTVSKLNGEYILQSAYIRYTLEFEAVKEIITRGGKEELYKALRQHSFDLSDYTARSGNNPDKLHFFELNEQLGEAVFKIAGRQAVNGCLKTPLLHYSRFENLYADEMMKNGALMPYNISFARSVRLGDTARLSEYKNSLLTEVESLLVKAKYAFPAYFI